MKREAAIILFSAGALLVLGAVAIGSLTVRQAEPYAFYSHLAHIGIGLAAMALINLVDYRWLRRWHLPEVLVATALVLLALALIPGVGTLTNSARRWLFGFQPSEFAKLALLVWLADYCARNIEYMHLRRVGFTRPIVVGVIAVGLVFKEPDWGTAALIAGVFGAVLWVAGTPTFYLAVSALIGIEVGVHYLIRSADKFTRILVFLDPGKYANSEGWQVWHSLLAIASGGWLGRFIGDGLHKLGFVPEQQTDFVMSLVGEELGFIGCAFVVLLYLSIVIAGTRIALRMADAFARFLALGITFLVGMQAIINIGVATSCLPNKGIPLPLVSHGGSDMVVMLAGIGLLMNLGRTAPLLQYAKLPGPETSVCPAGEPASLQAVPAWNVRTLAVRVIKRFVGIVQRKRNPFANEQSARPWQRPPRCCGEVVGH